MAADCGIVVLISGNGSNLQALIDESGHRGYRVAGVVCNEPSAFGLRRAARAGIPAAVVEHGDYPERADFDRALLAAVEKFAPGLIVLAGFMRILGPAFIEASLGRMLNIHPSLLPAYPGMRTLARVLAAGEREHGATVHFVNEKLDGGPIVARSRLMVGEDDTADSLAARIRRLEHALYPRVVGWYAAGRLRLGRDGGVYLDGAKLPTTGVEASEVAASIRCRGVGEDTADAVNTSM